MGGGIRLQSEEGKGSVFTVQLQAEAFFDEATVNPNTSDMSAREQLKSVIGKRVLLIDQSATSSRIMRQRLLDYQMDVIVVSDATQVTSHLKAAALDLDLIVIDVEHSPMALPELHQLMQSSDKLAQVPVLALTMQADLHVNYKLNLGAADPACLLKPVRESHLTEALLQLLFVSKQMGKLKHEQEQERRQGIPSLGNRFPLRMLVVDDNPTNRKVAGMMLERLGYQTSSAVDGRDAVDQILAADAKKQAFDVVWMDLHMPILDGLESTKIVRSAQIQQPQIIAVTAAAMHGDKEICLQAGMNDYVSKPLENAELQAALERFLRAKGFEVRRNSETESDASLPAASDSSDASAESPRYFDPNRFMAFCEGNPAYRSTFIGLIQNMLKRGPEQFDSAWKAWDERRVEDAARVFHTMRGSMGTLGAGVFVEASRQIESAILAEQEVEVESLFVEMQAILETTLQEAQAWLNQQAES
jgi:CheY-like chemotaxis protein